MKNKIKVGQIASWFTLVLVMACYVAVTIMMFLAHHVLTATLLMLLFPIAVVVEFREYKHLNK